MFELVSKFNVFGVDIGFAFTVLFGLAGIGIGFITIFGLTVVTTFISFLFSLFIQTLYFQLNYFIKKKDFLSFYFNFFNIYNNIFCF